MIELETFNKHMKRVLLLAGQNPPKEQMMAIYEAIQHYELEDFLKAVSDDQLIEEWSIRVNYPSLKRVIEKHMIDRLEREERERKKREKDLLEEAIKNDSLPEFVRDFLRKIKTL
ncbi:MAG: hypothetical protein ABDH16_02395 [Thermodesulfovibrionaceae bacterium]